MRFRTGELSLTQLVSRVEFEKSGLWFASLDDIIDKLPESIIKKLDRNDPYLMRAYNEIENEQKLLRDAAKRGISVNELKKTAKNFNIPRRCSKSIFSKAVNTAKLKSQ